MSPIFSFGEVLIDLLPTDIGSFKPMAGGAPANVAVAVAKLGGNSYFLGGISRDNLGQKLKCELEAHGVDTRFVAYKQNKTAIVLVTLDSVGERSFEFYRDNTADLAFNKQDIDDIQWQRDGILHFCSNTLCTEEQYKLSMTALSNAKQSDMLVCLDVNLRLNLWSQEQLSKLLPRVENVFRYTDIIKLSRDELTWLAEQKQLSTEQYLQLLIDGNCQLVLVTDGSNCITVVSKLWQQEVVPPNTKAVDTTGAGDSFIGGFLYKLATDSKIGLEQLANDQNKAIEYVEFASRCGAHTVTAKGAFALSSFRATARRFEIRGAREGVIVVDDYAHHPSEIRVNIEAARLRYPGHQIWALWQPHTYSRVKQFWSGFITAFEDADRVLVTPIYAAREKRVDGITSAALAEAISARGEARLTRTFEDAADCLRRFARAPAVVLIFSAGDANQIADLYLGSDE